MTQRDGMGREEGSGWGTRVYLWRTHVDIWQNQYNIVRLKNKIKKKKKLWELENKLFYRYTSSSGMATAIGSPDPHSGMKD